MRSRNDKGNSPNMLPIITNVQGLFKFMKRHLLVIFSKKLDVFCLCYKHASFFPFFLFSINFHRKYIPSLWNMIKQSEFLLKRYDTTYIYDRYYIRTHVYVFLFSVKKMCVWIIASLTLKVTFRRYPLHGVYRTNFS